MTENMEYNGCPQKDSAEHKGYAEASRSFSRIWKERDSAQSKLLEAILYELNNLWMISGFIRQNQQVLLRETQEGTE